MKKVLNLSIILFLLFSAKTFSQEIEIDTTSFNYELIPSGNTKSLSTAYTELEGNVLTDINWLNNNPVNENKNIRDEKNRFVFMWMSGSPTVSIQLDDRVVTFLKADPSVVMAYMMGWTKYSLEHNYSNDAIDCTTAGITNAVNFYNKNRKHLKKSKELDQYKIMVEDQTLKRYIADILTR